ncbi:pyruvate dehydrogenase E1 component alpha subunit [Dongia mobilis]|uniref:Pyruvate dehydrogenase E1 component alpha subunit n=1 Tax=Dongia mobilis TaxID=578943 RepID=A0A4R6WSD9_9PROT|nr:thiamine pyrophosphate-dependent dehydrogenase E1 component subunit alpha [Dongia mobilis]TDQ82391.1 pyruvate dehydrogenase E1 component alpha subunit [Dongia mobilis]
MRPSPKQWLWMYQTMVKSRIFEERIAAAYFEGKSPVFNMANGPIPGEMHLSNGQEPCAVGVCAHLDAGDFVTATHRPHHIAIAKGVDLDAMAAEIFGKATGLSGGRGGHMHIFDAAVNFCCSGIIAQGMGPAVGAATAFKLRNERRVAVSFIGEGAANQGAFHESLNLAAIWQAPVVIVIEDNAWGISVAKAQSTAVPQNDARAAAYGMPGHRVAGNDPEAIFAVAGAAIARARAGEGPSLIEIETHRLAGHFIGDAEGYRPKGEKEALTDPIPQLRAKLLGLGILDPTADRALTDEAEALVDRAISKARAAAYPVPEQAYEKVFA